MNEVRKFFRGFRYAYEGLKYALSSQRNMKVHCVVAIFALLVGLMTAISKVEMLFLLLAITLVISAELMNTAVEQAVDLAMPERHPLAKNAKDAAAGAVLVTAVFAVVTGAVIFYRPLDELLASFRYRDAIAPEMVWMIAAFVAVSVLLIQTRISPGYGYAAPSLTAAVAFAIAAFVALAGLGTIRVLFCYILAGLVMLVLYENKRGYVLSLMLGAVIGSLLAAAAYYII